MKKIDLSYQEQLNNLASLYKKNNIILFVGAGVSMSLGLPSWSKLIDQLAKELGFEPDIYKLFGNDYSLAEYYQIEKGNTHSLRQWMETNWYTNKIKQYHEKSVIHSLIAKSEFPIIYTTNYDRWIEQSFIAHKKKYTKISSVSDIKNIKENVTQIIKFHGDLENEETLVLGESSYYQRLGFETPLDIKLRSDVLGKSVLFIGYSLTDMNIRFLFYKLAQLWKNCSSNSIQPRSYLFTDKPNPVEKAILDQWGIDMVVAEENSPQDALENFLSNLIEH